MPAQIIILISELSMIRPTDREIEDSKTNWTNGTPFWSQDARILRQLCWLSQ